MPLRMLCAGVLGLAIGLSANRPLAATEKATDFEAEQAQMAKEDADQQAERDKGIKGKYQVMFLGTVYLLKQANEEINPDVVGYFVTSDRDKKPKRTYQIRLARKSAALMEAIKQTERKPVRASGVLRVLDANGEAKYLILDSITVDSPTPRVPERRSASGL